MFQFFVKPEQIVENKILITGKDVQHIAHVLRMKKGDEIAVFNGVDEKEYHCLIGEIESEQIICDLCFVKEISNESSNKIYLFQGLPKNDKMELIIQKAVELGVYEVIPVAMKRCVVKLDDKKSNAKVARWQGICEAAAKQSKRGIIPNIHEVLSFEKAIEYAKQLDHVLLPYELVKDQGICETRRIFRTIQENDSIGIFIGPEGGFDQVEVELSRAIGVQLISLGKRILRTETAGLTVLSFLMYELET